MSEENNIKFVDMTVFHIPEALAREFKEFCRLHARSKYSVGMELLLNSFKEKESYLYLVNEVSSLREEVNKIKEQVAPLIEKPEEVKGVKTFGGVLSQNE